MRYYPPLAHKHARMFQRYLKRVGVRSRFKYVGRGARIYVGAKGSFVTVAADSTIRTVMHREQVFFPGDVPPEAFAEALARYDQYVRGLPKKKESP